MENLQSLKVDVTKLYTVTEYAKKVGLTKGRISQMVKAKLLHTVKVNGTTLVYCD